MGIYLVCEGPADGLDVRVLDLIIAQKFNLPVQIIPAGGSGNLGGVAKWLEERSRRRVPGGGLGHPRDRAYTIADRDFLPAEDVERVWQKPQSRRLVWRRHEIENYLLDPRLVAFAFRSLSDDGVRGAGRLPHTPPSVRDVLANLARPMLEDHAGWLTYWHLVSGKRDAVDTRLRWPSPSLKPSSDSKYPGREEWLDYLRSECARLKSDCRRLADDVILSDESVTREYERFLSAVTRPDFLSGEQFLVDMDGHNLLAALSDYVNRSGVPGLSRADLEGELLAALDELYAPGFFAPDDLSLLAERLSA